MRKLQQSCPPCQPRLPGHPFALFIWECWQDFAQTLEHSLYSLCALIPCGSVQSMSLTAAVGGSTGFSTQTLHTSSALQHHRSTCQTLQGPQGSGVGRDNLRQDKDGSLKGCKHNTPLLKASWCHDRMVTNMPPVTAGAFLSLVHYSFERSSLPACVRLLFGLAALCDLCLPVNASTSFDVRRQYLQ